MLVPLDRLSELTAAIFDGEQPEIYQAYPEYEREPRQLANAKQLDDYMLASRQMGKEFFDFAIWYPSSAGSVEKERIELKPDKCDGHTFRYAIGGWGIFHLQCDFKRVPLIECRIAVNSQTRAKKWEPTYPDLLPVQEWNWPAIEKVMIYLPHHELDRTEP